MKAFFENAELTGEWSYIAGVDGTANIPAGARFVGLSCSTESTSGNVTIDGGGQIPLPANSGFALNPAAQLIGPFGITFAGTSSFVVEYIL